MADKTVTEILELALAHSKKSPNETLGNCLYGNGLNTDHIISLLKLSHDAIEDQYYEDAPNGETQSFLDSIKKITANYKKHF